ncbi:MAG: hypothetical protein OXC82_01195 [Rhodobacteraceae bacterium]|nr:hypothetical protein [Paracoccaceae bacterium]MCY4249043.1 hypothetical protein [Paracoccaceae bacterium]
MTLPLSSFPKALTRWGGIFERLAMALWRIRFPSLHDRRRRIADGDVRFGMMSMLRPMFCFLFTWQHHCF